MLVSDVNTRSRMADVLSASPPPAGGDRMILELRLLDGLGLMTRRNQPFLPLQSERGAKRAWGKASVGHSEREQSERGAQRAWGKASVGQSGRRERVAPQAWGTARMQMRPQPSLARGA